MDFVNKLAGGAQNQGQSANEQVMQDKNSGSSSQGGFLGGIGNKLNEAAGGGKASEKNEDYLDKGTRCPALSLPSSSSSPTLTYTNERRENLTNNVTGVDFVQEKFLGQGPQDNESALEQAKDEQISDAIRGQYKNMTGKDMPFKDK